MVFFDLENRIFSLCRQGVSPLSAYTSAYIYILSYTLSYSWVANRLSSCENSMLRAVIPYLCRMQVLGMHAMPHILIGCFGLRLFQPAVVSACGCFSLCICCTCATVSNYY